eukprot:scaffold5711_cov202-Prasinococcus_capsulatus_cf.AAC.1
MQKQAEEQELASMRERYEQQLSWIDRQRLTAQREMPLTEAQQAELAALSASQAADVQTLRHAHTEEMRRVDERQSRRARLDSFLSHTSEIAARLDSTAQEQERARKERLRQAAATSYQQVRAHALLPMRKHTRCGAAACSPARA